MRPVIFFRWLLFSWRFLGTCAVVLLCVAAGVSVVSRAFVAPVEAASAVDKAAARYVETTEGRTAYLAVLQARFRADAADPAEQARVERLLVPLATAAGRTLPLVVVSSEDKVNAYALPDAFVVHHGMLALLTDDGELSVLLAHELGHLALDHPVRGIRRGMRAQYFVRRAAKAKTLDDGATAFVEAALHAELGLHEERAADAWAAKLLPQAGVPAAAGVTVWDHLRAAGLSDRGHSHPSYDERKRVFGGAAEK